MKTRGFCAVRTTTQHGIEVVRSICRGIRMFLPRRPEVTEAVGHELIIAMPSRRGLSAVGCQRPA